MARRKLTFAQAEEIRRLRATTGATIKALCATYGISMDPICKIINRQTYVTIEQQTGLPDLPPTPHDALTYAGWNRNMLPMPAVRDDIQRQYAAQNERDGYLSDPLYMAAVAAWRSESREMAAD